MTTAEELYPLVTEAIQRAETLEDLEAPGVHSAYLDVSKLEEKVAELLPASDPEGVLARRGAVRAAVAAKEFARARMLAERFLADADLDESSQASIRELVEQAERSQAARFPKVAEKFGFQEIHRIAQAFKLQAAPFPIG